MRFERQTMQFFADYRKSKISSSGKSDLLMEATEERFTRNIQHGASKSGLE